MDARCYRGDINRTKMKIMKFVRRDYMASAVIVVYVIILFLIDRI